MTDSRQKSYDALDDLLTELRQLHEESRPSLKPGEWTIDQYAEANKGTDMTRNDADNLIRIYIRQGKVEKVGLRFVDHKMRMAFRKKSPN